MGELGCIICVTITLVVAGIIAVIYNVSVGGGTGLRTNHYHHYDNQFDSTGTGGGKNNKVWSYGIGGRGADGGTRLGSSRGSYGSSYGNCFSDSAIVWTKNESSSDITARKVRAIDLKEGDLVETFDVSSSLKPNNQFSWTRATDVSIYQGNWTAHTFEFSKQLHLTVTSPHLMIILKKEKFFFIRADHVEINDTMLVNKRLIKVIGIKNHQIKRKVAIETEDGTLQVNGVWASGFCDDNVQARNRIAEYKSVIEDYKLRHFGEEYNSMCMDKVAWEIAYHRNNELFR